MRAYAFYSSNSITDIIIPRSVRSIEDRAIALCPQVKTIRLMGKDNVPELSKEILFESADPKNVEIYVRKAWYEDPNNQALVQRYEQAFKHVRRSFIPAAGYDRGAEFFQTSDTEVGLISFEDSHERTSVIVYPKAKQPAYSTLNGTQVPEAEFDVTSVLDFAFEDKGNGTPRVVKAITFLGEIKHIGLNAFKRNSIEQVFFVGDTPPVLNYDQYDMPVSYPFGQTQKIYVKPSKVAAYRAAWNKNVASVGYEVGVESDIPQTTAKHGGSACFPFDVVYPTDGGLVPYIPLGYDNASLDGEGTVRAYSVDDGFVPAFTGVLLRSEATPSLTACCQMDETQGHSTSTLEAIGYQASDYRLKGTVEDEVVNTSGTNYRHFAFSRSRGGFAPLSDGVNVPYFKAYLRMPLAAQVKGFRISFNPAAELANHIQPATEAAAQTSKANYTLGGIRAQSTAKGLLIQGGKKFIKR